MNITSYADRQSVLAWVERAKMLLAQRDNTLVGAIDEAVEQFCENRFVLTVLGKAKRGKSTLVNALLGRRDDIIAPIDKLPASSTITRFVWADKPSATVFYRNATSAPAHSEAISYERVREFVTEENNPGNRKGVESVQVAGPFPGFDPDLVLIDTPGAGSIYEYHDALLHSFLPQSDAVIFLVTARMPLDEDELDLLKKVKAADIRKVIFAINKVDRAAEGDIDAAVTHNVALLSQIGIQVDHIHRISAKQAFEGQVDASGVPALLSEVQSLLTVNKAKMLAERFVARISEIALPVCRGLAAELAAYGKSDAEIVQGRQSLVEVKNRLETDRLNLERRFLTRWNAALDHFAHQVDSVREQVKASIVASVQSASLVNLPKMARELPNTVAQSIEARLEPPTKELEKSLQDCCRELQVQYPSLKLESDHSVVFGRSHNSVLVAGTAGAAAATAAGAGLVTAANAAAVASVAYVTTPSWIGVALTYLTGTCGPAVTTTVIPSTIPVWVALAGPIGWTLAGVGALAIPFAWTISKHKQRAQLDDQSAQQIDKVFDFIKVERVPLLRRSGEVILESFRSRLEQELLQVDKSLSKLQLTKLSEEETAATEKLADELHELLETGAGAVNGLRT